MKLDVSRLYRIYGVIRRAMDFRLIVKRLVVPFSRLDGKWVAWKFIKSPIAIYRSPISRLLSSSRIARRIGDTRSLIVDRSTWSSTSPDPPTIRDSRECTCACVHRARPHVLTQSQRTGRIARVCATQKMRLKACVQHAYYYGHCNTRRVICALPISESAWPFCSVFFFFCIRDLHNRLW